MHSDTALDRFSLFGHIQKYKIFPHSCLDIGERRLTIRQKRITSHKLSSVSLTEARASSKDFFIRLKQAWDDGFVHGDINRRNIFCDGNGLGLYDFEPYLEVIQNGRFRLQATKPYVCPVDLKIKKISRSTDEIGVACFLHWFCFDRKISPAQFCQKILLPKKEVLTKEILSTFL